MTYATVEDVEARWRPLEPEESSVALVLLVDAEMILDNKVPTLAGAFGSDGRLDRLATYTICEMVKRVLRNPDAMRQQSVGDIQQTFGGPEYDGRLYLSLEEQATLEDALAALVPGASAGGAFSINPVRTQLANRRPSWRVSPHTPR